MPIQRFGQPSNQSVQECHGKSPPVSYCSPKAAPRPSQPKPVTQLFLIQQEQGKMGCPLTARSERVRIDFSTAITKVRGVVGPILFFLLKHVPTTSLTLGAIFSGYRQRGYTALGTGHRRSTPGLLLLLSPQSPLACSNLSSSPCV